MLNKIIIKEFKLDDDDNEILVSRYDLEEFIEEINLSPELRVINDVEHYFKIEIDED